MTNITKVRRHISHWAMLPLSQFENDTSLKNLRPDFGQVSKLAVIVTATFKKEIKYEDFVDEVNGLDTVNDFIRFFKDKKLKINNTHTPLGY